MALDVETVGIDPWQPGARLRTVQLAAGPGEVWIDPRPGQAVTDILRAARAILGHNVFFDLLWLARAGLLPLEDAAGKVVDTLHLAHLRDNRTRTARYLGEGIDRWTRPLSPTTTRTKTSPPAMVVETTETVTGYPRCGVLASVGHRPAQ